MKITKSLLYYGIQSSKYYQRASKNVLTEEKTHTPLKFHKLDYIICFWVMSQTKYFHFGILWNSSSTTMY